MENTLNNNIYNIDQLEAAAEVEAQLGPIDCLVNNAGVIHKTPCLMKSGNIEVFGKKVMSTCPLLW